MTRWHGAEEAPAAAAPVVARAAGRRTVSRQTRVLILAAVLLVVAALLAVVFLVVGGGSDGPAAGSPEAVTDRVAGALAANSRDRLAELSCPAARARVVRQARRLLVRTTSADRDGPATVSGQVAVDRVTVGVRAARGTTSAPVTVALRRVDGAWCLDALGVPRLAG